MTDTIETPTAPTKSRFAKFWDSDFAWSFRHSPVALIASLVVLILLLAACAEPIDRRGAEHNTCGRRAGTRRSGNGVTCRDASPLRASPAAFPEDRPH